MPEVRTPQAHQHGLNLALLHATPSAVLTLNADGRITFLNAAAERLLSVEEQGAAGRPYTEVFGPSLASRMVGLFQRGMRAQDPHNGRLLEVTLPGGRRALLWATVGPLRDARGALTGAFFVAEERPPYTPALGRADALAVKEQHVREALERYGATTVAARSAAPASSVAVGGVRQTVSVLQADVRGYTTLAEALEPEEVSRLLLQYHGTAAAALGHAQATIDRYIGDAIVAFWNAPLAQADHPRLALAGALAVRQATQAVGRDLEYGIGVHTGEAIVGNIGADQHLHYTAIGDTVNVAARLQSAAPAGGIFCSAATLAAAGPGLHATPLGLLTVKGRKQPVEGYAVEGMD